jgi:hypothetical protein
VCRNLNHSILHQLTQDWRIECIWGRGYAMLATGDWLSNSERRPPRTNRGEMGNYDLENRLCEPVPEVAA